MSAPSINRDALLHPQLWWNAGDASLEPPGRQEECHRDLVLPGAVGSARGGGPVFRASLALSGGQRCRRLACLRGLDVCNLGSQEAQQGQERSNRRETEERAKSARAVTS